MRNLHSICSTKLTQLLCSWSLCVILSLIYVSAQDCSETVASYTPLSTEFDVIDIDNQYVQVFKSNSSTSNFEVNLELAFCEENGLPNGQLDIVTVTAGVPDWENLIGSAIVSNVDIYKRPACTDNTFGTSTFSFSGVELEAGKQYAIVLKLGSASNSDSKILWRSSSSLQDSDNPYGEGDSWTISISVIRPITRRANPRFDLQFQILSCTDSDGDNDGIPNEEDNCPQISNADQSDIDRDGIGDECDEELSIQGAGDALIEDIKDLDLPRGLENVLINKIEKTMGRCARGNPYGAINSLRELIRFINDRCRRNLSNEEANALIIIARAMRKAIKNGTSDCGSSARLGRDLQISDKLSVYPNPFKNTLIIEWEGLEQDVSISLSNLMGQQIYHQNLSLQYRQTLSIQDLPKGIYILQIVGENFKQKVKVIRE